MSDVDDTSGGELDVPSIDLDVYDDTDQAGAEDGTGTAVDIVGAELELADLEVSDVDQVVIDVEVVDPSGLDVPAPSGVGWDPPAPTAAPPGGWTPPTSSAGSGGGGSRKRRGRRGGGGGGGGGGGRGGMVNISFIGGILNDASAVKINDPSVIRTGAIASGNAGMRTGSVASGNSALHGRPPAGRRRRPI